jgi:hypothetical protein
MQPASNCLRSGRQLQQGHTPLAHRAVHSSRLPTCIAWHPRPCLQPLLHTAKQPQPCSAPHRGSSIRAAAAPAVVPVSVAAAASFPALQHALAPVLPYIMAAAAACCAALVALVSSTVTEWLACMRWDAAVSHNSLSRGRAPSTLTKPHALSLPCTPADGHRAQLRPHTTQRALQPAASTAGCCVRCCAARQLVE